MPPNTYWPSYVSLRSVLVRVFIWIGFTILAIAVLTTIILPIAKFASDVVIPPYVGRPSCSKIYGAFVASILLAFPSVLIETVVALHLGRLLRLSGAGLYILLCFCAPLFFGPTVCALLWKALLDPNSGMIAIISGALGTSMPDWSQSATGARLVIVALQVWTWGLVGGAGVAALFGEDAQKARVLYLLDGGRRAFADLWALWSTRREWVALLLIALVVENLRAFEAIHVLTSGGPGTYTTTLAYRVFETGFLNTSNPGTSGSQALWIWLLIILNGVASSCIYYGLKRSGRALEEA
jgi:ABC-type sugar transport system permease subunit